MKNRCVPGYDAKHLLRASLIIGGVSGGEKAPPCVTGNITEHVSSPHTPLFPSQLQMLRILPSDSPLEFQDL